MASWIRLGCAATSLASLLLVTASAAAQSSAKEKAAAEALFQEGKRLLDQGQYEQACNKFAASQQLDAGFGTLLNLGDCYERRGMTASAWATFKEAAALARAADQTERETAARERAAALENKLSRVLVSAPPALVGLQGAQVRLNGTPLPQAVWGSPVPVDPGLQRVDVTAPGHRPWSTELTVPPGPAEAKLELPLLEPLPASESPTSSSATAGASTGSGSSQSLVEDGATQRTIGYVMAGAGGVGLVIGSIFGLDAISKNSDSDDHCREETLCSPRGLTLRADAQDAATVSTIAFLAGGALAAGGVALVLAAPTGPEGTRPEG
ncbi:MAG TPA: hypothetical protein VIM73_21505, partial [Polyangiaceae bacterium]